MEEYKQRMAEEYRQTRSRYDKLHHLLVLHDAGRLTFKLNTPVELLREQAGYSQLLPAQTGEVYGCNVMTSMFYEESPFRPDLLSRYRSCDRSDALKHRCWFQCRTVF